MIPGVTAAPDDFEPWPIAPGAPFSWRDGGRFCTYLVRDVDLDDEQDPARAVIDAEMGEFHEHAVDGADGVGVVMAGPGVDDVVAVARVRRVDDGVVVVGRLLEGVNPADLRTAVGMSGEWANVGTGRWLLRGMAFVTLPGHLPGPGRPGPGIPLRDLRRGLANPALVTALDAEPVDPADFLAWPLAPGALISWRDGGRFCAYPGRIDRVRTCAEADMIALGGDLVPFHHHLVPSTLGGGRRELLGQVTADDDVPVGWVKITRDEVGVAAVGRLFPGLDAAPYRAGTLRTEWRLAGEGIRWELERVRFVLPSGAPLPDGRHVPGYPVYLLGLDGRGVPGS